MKKKNYLVIGGSRGVGAAISKKLLDCDNNVHIYDIVEPSAFISTATFHKFDLCKDEFDLEQLNNADGVYITAGIGRVAKSTDLSICEIEKTIKTNMVSIIKLLKYMEKSLFSNKSFECCVITSISGYIVSPLFSAYSASKAGLSKYIDALNIELFKDGYRNVITNIVAASFEGTSFNGGETDYAATSSLADEIICATQSKERIHKINKPLVDDILTRYYSDSFVFGCESYDYKMTHNRIVKKRKITIGYLSGTFDLFHIGHLNLLRRAKEMCDYLIVGVHKDASHKGKTTFIPFEERIEIVKQIKYVDQVIESLPEDSDAWQLFHYDFLFVGSDYKGSQRFENYEKFFSDKNVRIVYFPYTTGTSSSQLREALSKIKK